MLERLKKLHWLDIVLLVLLVATVAFIWYRIEGTLNYRWQWHIIPNYIVRFDAEEGRWVANLLLQGVITTIRISLYASVLAVILGVMLGVARCASNLAVRMLARTYVELLRNIPPVVIIFIFFFFLSEQLVSAFGIEDWARAIARQENNEVWEFFFGDMRRFPSLISGVIVLALFESAFVGEIVRAGIQSIAKGQREAARSIGLSKVDQLRFISVQELTFKTVELVASTRAIFEAWITTALFYFAICFGLSMLFRRFESSSTKR